jgi:hypothetical protein
MTKDIIQYPRYETIDRTIKARHVEFLEKFGVHHVGISKKFTAGQKLPLTSVTFYVLRKGNVPPDKRVPSSLALEYLDEGEHGRVATDVCEIGDQPVALFIRGGNTIIAFDNEHGTVGLVFRHEGQDYVLTNAHVVTDPGVPPAPLRIDVPGPSGLVTIGGTVVRIDNLSAPNIRSDAALVEVPLNSVAPGMFRGTDLILIGFDDIQLNDPRKFYFVSMEFVHELRWTAWVNTGASVTIDGYARTCSGFHKFRMIKGVVRPGNSGAVIFCVTNGGLVAVGLLFAAALSINEAWVFPVRRCLNQMGIPA